MERGKGWARRVSRLGAFVLVQVIAVFALLEVSARILDPMGISYYPETARYLDTLVHEERIGYRNRPGLRGTFYGTPVEINSLGMRDREVPAEPEPGEYRVMVLGDSVVFGLGVRYDASIPAQLEQILNDGAPSGRRYRTLNMGVPSYNTEQEMLVFEESVARLRPDLVVLLFVTNDIEKKNWVLEKRAAWYADAAQRSYAASLLFTGVRLARTRTAAPASAVAGAARFATEDERWQAVDAALSRLAMLTRERGIPFVVYTQVGTQQVHGLVESVGAREGFPVLEVSPGRDPRFQGFDSRRLRISVVNNHLGPEGLRIVATWLSDSLRQLGVLGETAATGSGNPASSRP